MSMMFVVQVRRRETPGTAVAVLTREHASNGSVEINVCGHEEGSNVRDESCGSALDSI